MPDIQYDASKTGLLLVDPYNDFLSEGGKLWPMIQQVAEKVSLHDHLRSILTAARAGGIQVFYVPHHRWEPGDFEAWDHPNPVQERTKTAHVFAKGTWGGEFHPDFAPHPGDIVVKEHWAQSGFANTDLDMLLKQKGITHVIAIGVVANTCIESTSRFAMELGYHVTLVRDATAAASPDAMHAAHDVNGPTFAHAIFTTSELLAVLPPSKNLEVAANRG